MAYYEDFDMQAFIFIQGKGFLELKINVKNFVNEFFFKGT